MKVFYNNKQSVAVNHSFSPSAGKPEHVVGHWLKQGLITNIEASFAPMLASDISLVHSSDYVRKVLACEKPNGFGNINPDVAASLPWVCGNVVAAALHAYQTKEYAFSPTSGAHHASWKHGGGFCTFNSLVLAALKAHQAGAKRVAIVDLDMHWGDGTQDIIDKLGIDFIEHYSFSKQKVKANDALAWATFKFPEDLEKLPKVDLIMVNAGVDSHVDDPLGGIMSDKAMAMRDYMVFRYARMQGIPTCITLAGGYQKMDKLIALHTETLSQAIRWEKYEIIS